MIYHGTSEKNKSLNNGISLNKKIYFSSLVLITLSAIMSGCGQMKEDSFKLSDALQYHPHKLYLQKEPYSEIYVEVDSLENTVVPDLYLDTIKEFLSQHCDKEKITVVKDEPISLKPSQQNMPLELISLLYTDGPKDQNSNCAYIHCFFYSKKDKIKANVNNPYVNGNTATTAFFNMSYVKYDKDAQQHFIRHELGHILGLCTNTKHGDGSHCSNKCLMEASVDVYFLTPIYKVFGQSNKGMGLCEVCKRDLSSIKDQDYDQALNLSFRGPFLTRTERDYTVLALPFFYIIAEESKEKAKYDWLKVLKETRVELSNLPESTWPKGKMKRLFGYNTENKNSEYELSKDTELLLKISKDPVSSIREYAEAQLKKKNAE